MVLLAGIRDGGICIFVAVLVLLSTADAKYEAPTADFNRALGSVGRALRHYLAAQTEDYKLGEGVHLIKSMPLIRKANARSAEETTFLGEMQNYLENHEIKIKLPELFPNSQDVGRAFKESVGSIDDNGTARGKNKGQGGALLLLGSMFASMMGALGLGGVGLLAMKALAVSAMALMLAAVVGIKKLASGHDDGGGHHVIHAEGHGHRRRRDAADIAYRAWQNYSDEDTSPQQQ